MGHTLFKHKAEQNNKKTVSRKLAFGRLFFCCFIRREPNIEDLRSKFEMAQLCAETDYSDPRTVSFFLFLDIFAKRA